MNPLHDDELDRALEHWRVPDPPARLEAATMAACRAELRRPGGWRTLLSMRVHVPLPIAAVAVVALLCLSMALVRVQPESHRAGPAAATSADPAQLSWGGLRPVSELRLRVIRGHDETH